MGLFAANPQPFKKGQNLPLAKTSPGNKSGNALRHRPKSSQGTSTGGRLAGSLLYSTVRPRQFIVVPLQKPPEKPACAVCTHHLHRRPPPQTTPLPRCRLRPQPHPAKDFLKYAWTLSCRYHPHRGCSDFSPCHTQGTTEATPQPPDLSIGSRIRHCRNGCPWLTALE